MQLTLVLPGLIARRADDGGDPCAGTGASHRAGRHAVGARKAAPAAALAARYGVTRQIDWPLAPIRLAALDVDPEDAYWLAADPVTLEAGRADVSLAGIVADLERADADALLATLNAHFADDGLTFVAPRPDAFFVRAARPMRLATRSPGAALGRPLRAMLPAGRGRARLGGAGNRKSRCCCTSIRSISRGNAPDARRRTACGSPAAGRCRGAPAPAPSIRTYATADVAVALAHFIGQPARPPRGAPRCNAARCRERGIDRRRSRGRARHRRARTIVGGARPRRARARRASGGDRALRRRRRRRDLARGAPGTVATADRPPSGARSRGAARRRGKNR